MHGHLAHFLKDMDHTIENKGDTLVITIKGDKAQLKKIETTLNALKDLHEAWGEECDCDGHCGCC